MEVLLDVVAYPHVRGLPLNVVFVSRLQVVQGVTNLKQVIIAFEKRNLIKWLIREYQLFGPIKGD